MQPGNYTYEWAVWGKEQEFPGNGEYAKSLGYASLGELLAPRTFAIKLNLQIYFQSYAPALEDFKANSTLAVRRGETQSFYLGVFKDQDLTDQVLLDLITELPQFLTLSVGENNYKPGMDVKNK